MPSGSNKGQIIVAVLGFAGVLFTTLSSNWDKWFPRPAPTPIVTPPQLVSPTPPATTAPPETATPLDTITLPANSTPRVIPTPRVTPFLLHTTNPRVTITQSDITTPPDTTPLPARPSPRVTATRQAAPTPPASPNPRVAAIPASPPTPPASSTSITSPRHGATVGQKIAVEGVLAELRPEQHVFLCLKSQAFGRLIYPQGQVIPDGTGQWTVVSIYGTPGYSYETFLVSTSNPESATMLNAQQSRKYGMRDLPPGTERLGTAIVVTRE